MRSDVRASANSGSGNEECLLSLSMDGSAASSQEENSLTSGRPNHTYLTSDDQEAMLIEIVSQRCSAAEGSSWELFYFYQRSQNAKSKIRMGLPGIADFDGWLSSGSQFW